MKTKNMIWAALSMTAALVMTACSNDDNTVETPAAPQAEVKTIPYSVTVGQGGDAASTRATVADDMKTLKFAAGDKLYITGENISGVLTLKSSDEGKSSGATFEGDLTYKGGDSPASDLPLTAFLVGTSNKGWNIEDGKVTTFSYLNSAYCTDVNDAVEKYSLLMGSSNYSAKSFTLKQQTAFLNFEITFEDGTTSGTTLSAVVSNNGSAIATANVTTTIVGGKVVAKFVLPVMSGATTLSSATVKMGDKAALTINDATLEAKVYNVKRTQAAAATTLNNTTTAWTAGSYAVPAGGLTYSDAITVSGDVTLVLTDGETLTLNKGISLAEGATLTIQGNGTMNVNGTNSSTASTVAGNGTLVLTSGTLTATGGNGGSVGSECDVCTAGTGGVAINGSVIVSGGTLTATGGNGGNVGSNCYSSTAGKGGDAISGTLTVNGGTLTARGGNGGNVGNDCDNCSGGNGGDAISGTLTVNGGSTSVNDGSNGSIGSDCVDCTAGTGGKGHN